MTDDKQERTSTYLHGKILLLSNDELGHRLGDLPVFNGLPADVIESLRAISSILHVNQGDYVLNQDQVNTRLFVLLEGGLGVYVSGERIAEIKRRGDLIGEMSVISATPCSASVIAETACQLMVRSKAAVKPMRRLKFSLPMRYTTGIVATKKISDSTRAVATPLPNATVQKWSST